MPPNFSPIHSVILTPIFFFCPEWDSSSTHIRLITEIQQAALAAPRVPVNLVLLAPPDLPFSYWTQVQGGLPIHSCSSYSTVSKSLRPRSHCIVDWPLSFIHIVSILPLRLLVLGVSQRRKIEAINTCRIGHHNIHTILHSLVSSPVFVMHL
jgi:hypothetical protein